MGLQIFNDRKREDDSFNETNVEAVSHNAHEKAGLNKLGQQIPCPKCGYYNPCSRKLPEDCWNISCQVN